MQKLQAWNSDADLNVAVSDYARELFCVTFYTSGMVFWNDNSAPIALPKRGGNVVTPDVI
jgi:hypothetical protein